MSEFESAANTKKIVLGVVVLAVVIGGTVIGMSLIGGGPTGPPGKALTILTRHDVSIQSVFRSAFLNSDFAKANHITEITWKTSTGEFWDELIAAGGIDVCWGGGPTLFDQLLRDGRLAPLTSPLMTAALARVNNTLAGADMKRNNTLGQTMWVAAAISSFGFIVNHAFLDEYQLPVPHKWTDLANATYGKLLPTIPTLAMGNAPGTTSNTRIYEIITQALGWDDGWITMARMAGSARIYPGSVETQTAAETGQVGVAMAIDFYGYLSQSKNPDCEYIIPQGQTIVNGDPIAIPFNAPNMTLSEGFLDWMFMPETQALWLNPNIMRMPVMREAFDTPYGSTKTTLYATFNQTVQNTGIDFNDTLSVLTNTAFTKYFEAVFTDAHNELVSCWDLMVDALLAGHISEAEFNSFAIQMGTPVTIVDPKSSLSRKFTVQYAIDMNSDMISDPTYAEQVQNLWTTAAKAQYAAVYAAVDALVP